MPFSSCAGERNIANSAIHSVATPWELFTVSSSLFHIFTLNPVAMYLEFQLCHYCNVTQALTLVGIPAVYIDTAGIPAVSI